MIHVKKVLRAFVPPVIISSLRPKRKLAKEQKPPEIFSGDFQQWNEARKLSTGYDISRILEKCRSALLKVKVGEAVYERDSVLFDEIQYSWGLLSGLQNAAIENDNQLCVLDFGGSLGSTYFQNKDFLKGLKSVTWCIVEQPHFVECGRQHFENEQLRFYYSVEDCLEHHSPNVLLLSGVLQYLEFPFKLLEKLLSCRVSMVIIDRTAFVESENDMLTIQNVPEWIYKASYPAWFFNEKNFLSRFQCYERLGSFNSFCDKDIVLNRINRAYWKGFIFLRK